jgi:hypothetical protein
MRESWFGVLALGVCCLALASEIPAARRHGCKYWAGPQFSAGHDDKGYYVRSARRDAAFVGHARQTVTVVGDELAAKTGATSIYLWPSTVRDVESGEWRGQDPLGAFTAFAHAGGLEVISPSPGWWLTGPPDWIESGPVTITSRCVSPPGQGWASAADVAELERALVTQLPVRDIRRQGGRGEAAMNLSYYWLPEEGPDTLLVLTSQPGGEFPPLYRGFKVRVSREGPEVKVDCIWAMGDNHVPSGRFVPEIAEDFDGDGYRDFVFYAEDERFVNTIVSGRDGRLLLPFSGAEVAVGRNPQAPLSFAVEGTYDLEYGGENPHIEGAVHEGPVVLTVDRANGQLGPAPGTGARVATQAIAQTAGGQFNGPRRALAVALGGTDKVRVYILQGGVHYPGGGYEEINAADRHHPERVLFRYEPLGGINKTRPLQH